MSELNMTGNNSKFLQWFLQWLQKVLCDAATRCPYKSSIYKITNSKNDVLNDDLKKVICPNSEMQQHNLYRKNKMYVSFQIHSVYKKIVLKKYL